MINSLESFEDKLDTLIKVAGYVKQKLSEDKLMIRDVAQLAELSDNIAQSSSMIVVSRYKESLEIKK